MRFAILSLALLLLSRCNPYAGHNLSFVDGETIELIAHQSNFNAASPFTLAPADVAAVVLPANLQGFLVNPLPGYGKSLEDLERFLRDNPKSQALLSFYLDKSIFAKACDGELADYLNEWIGLANRAEGQLAFIFGFQVNSPIWQIEPEIFSTGYRCMVEAFRAAGVTNDKVSFGVHLSSLSPNYSDRASSDWMPLSEYVNFIALDVSRFAPDHFTPTDEVFTRTALPEVHALAEDLGMPIVITEVNPYATFRVLPQGGDTLYGNFYQPLIEELKKYPTVRAVAQTSGTVADSATMRKFSSALKSLRP